MDGPILRGIILRGRYVSVVGGGEAETLGEVNKKLRAPERRTEKEIRLPGALLLLRRVLSWVDQQRSSTDS